MDESQLILSCQCAAVKRYSVPPAATNEKRVNSFINVGNRLFILRKCDSAVLQITMIHNNYSAAGVKTQ